MKKTLIIGASDNPERYSYKAAERLLKHGHEIELVGIRSVEVFGKQVDTEMKHYGNIDTVTMYVGPQNQPQYYAYILSLSPKRVIFNPGTENYEFESRLKSAGIETEEACTLVMLGTGQY